MLTQQTNNQLLLRVFNHPPALPARQKLPQKHRETETESWTTQHNLTAYQIPFSKNKSQLHIHANPAPDTTTTTTTSTNKEEENYSDETTKTTAETEDEVTTTPAAQQHALLLNSST